MSSNLQTTATSRMGPIRRTNRRNKSDRLAIYAEAEYTRRRVEALDPSMLPPANASRAASADMTEPEGKPNRWDIARGALIAALVVGAICGFGIGTRYVPPYLAAVDPNG